MEQTLQDLRDLRTHFLEPLRWNKGCTARNGLGESVTFDHPDARSWCLYGAMRLIGGARWFELDRALSRVRLGYHKFNDSYLTKHHDIIEFINEAIEQEKLHG